ncbi:unnamed protein product [Tilletia laevis]|uniref:Uncharacterized protein n=1 Tax=Tilletia laevis TaxID=157183 RepID=A0A9N8Q9S4_9BASI|nr:hypothetical protein CF335_g2702 [Tilletia laevis]CAD6907355.1 unnamed protein product [Tilletia laevis]CAD6914452.1 unnamed protein product [Tilletia laevis]CAD6956515.1 unnamed protein product [Tilletia controversa]
MSTRFSSPLSSPPRPRARARQARVLPDSDSETGSSSPLSSPPRPSARQALVLSDSDSDNDGYPADEAPEDNLSPEEDVADGPEPDDADDVAVEAQSTDGDDNGEDLLDFVVPPGAEMEDVPSTSTGEESAESTPQSSPESVVAVAGGGHHLLEDDPEGDYYPPRDVAANDYDVEDHEGDDFGVDGSSDVAADDYGLIVDEFGAAAAVDIDDGHGPNAEDDADFAEDDADFAEDDADLAEDDAAYDDVVAVIEEAGFIQPLPRSDIIPSGGDSDSDFTITGIKRAACFKVGTISDSGAAYPLFKKVKS